MGRRPKNAPVAPPIPEMIEMPDEVPRKEDGTIDKEGEITVEQARKMGALNVESLRENLVMDQKIQQKKSGEKFVSMTSTDPTQAYQVFKDIWGDAGTSVQVLRMQRFSGEDIAMHLDPVPMNRFTDQYDFWAYLKGLNEGYPVTRYRVLFRDGSRERHRATFILDANQKEGPPPPQAAPLPPSWGGPLPPGYPPPGYPPGPPYGYPGYPSTPQAPPPAAPPPQQAPPPPTPPTYADPAGGQAAAMYAHTIEALRRQNEELLRLVAHGAPPPAAPPQQAPPPAPPPTPFESMQQIMQLQKEMVTQMEAYRAMMAPPAAVAPPGAPPPAAVAASAPWPSPPAPGWPASVVYPPPPPPLPTEPPWPSPPGMSGPPPMPPSPYPPPPYGGYPAPPPAPPAPPTPADAFGQINAAVSTLGEFMRTARRIESLGLAAGEPDEPPPPPPSTELANPAQDKPYHMMEYPVGDRTVRLAHKPDGDIHLAGSALANAPLLLEVLGNLRDTAAAMSDMRRGRRPAPPMTPAAAAAGARDYPSIPGEPSNVLPFPGR